MTLWLMDVVWRVFTFWTDLLLGNERGVKP